MGRTEFGSPGGGIQGVLFRSHVADGTGEGKVVRRIIGGFIYLLVDFKILGKQEPAEYEHEARENE
jgi:hypothetical protein